MTIPLFCILIGDVLPMVAKVPVAMAMKQEGAYDNHLPREQQARLSGWGKRALAAHLNAFEAFPVFAAAVLVAHVGGGDATWATGLSAAWVVLRLAYNGLYLADLATPRSTVWGLAYACALGLFVLPLFSR